MVEYYDNERKTNLKPCPFCGGNAEPKHDPFLNYWKIYCPHCGIYTQTWRTYDGAREHWNRRYNETHG